MKEFENKVALVTGGSSGIGRATALAFANKGAKVVVAARRNAEGEDTVSMIRDVGGDARFVQTDVSKTSEVEAMVNRCIDNYGRLDFAFNNAGIEGTPFVLTADYEEKNWDRVIEINLKGVWLCMKHQIPQMLKQGSGVIVNMSSVAGLRGGRVGGRAYYASKHGVIGLITRKFPLNKGIDLNLRSRRDPLRGALILSLSPNAIALLFILYAIAHSRFVIPRSLCENLQNFPYKP